MKRLSLSALVFLVGLCLGTLALGQKADKNNKQALPAAVSTAFHKAYPNATIKKSAKERKDGQTVYEVESVDQGRRRDILYTPDGSVVEVEEEVDQSALPEKVIAAIKRHHPRAVISKCEKVTRGSTLVYEISFKGTKLRDLVLNPDGTPVRAK